MDDVNDLELLRDYDRQGSEAAFATLVVRHINLVYSAAFHHTGNTAHAEEITQAVFVILAQKAASLRPDTVLEGWLYQTTRLTALSFLRGERRRQLREQEAYMQSTLADSADASLWNQLAPLLDDAMTQLRAQERNAIVLRYFQNQSLRDVGTSLGVDEYAAQKRISRALEKLRKIFTKKGAVTTGETIAGAISANYLQTAPVALAKSVTVVVTAKGAVAGGSTLALVKGALKLMAWTNAKNAIVAGAAVLLAIGTATVVLVPAHSAPTVSAPGQASATNAPRVLDLLNNVQAAAEAARTLTADFTYVTKTPNAGMTATVVEEIGTVRLMKPNFADIEYTVENRSGRHLVSDGTNLWNYNLAAGSYTKIPADPDGKNVNLWRLIVIGGFFDVKTWIAQGIYVNNFAELTYAGIETINGTSYQVLEHKMTGMMQGKACPFDQKVYIGPDMLIHRFTLEFTLDGRPGSETAELTNLKTGQTMTAADFVFIPPPNSIERTNSP